MKFEQSEDSRNFQTYILELDGFELVTLNFDGFERALLHECGKSEKISDKLLALEMIVRKIEENKEKGNKTKEV